MQDVGILCDLAQSSRFTVYSYVLLGWDNGSLSLMPYVNYYRSFTLSDCLSLCDEIFIFYFQRSWKLYTCQIWAKEVFSQGMGSSKTCCTKRGMKRFSEHSCYRFFRLFRRENLKGINRYRVNHQHTLSFQAFTIVV